MHTHAHRLAHMCKGEERESERESGESPSCLRAVSQQGSQKYRLPLLHWTLASTLFWAYPSQWYQHVSVRVCVYGSSLLLFVPYGLGLPVFTCYQTCSYLFNIDNFFGNMYISLRISVYIELSVNEDDWPAT